MDSANKFGFIMKKSIGMIYTVSEISKYHKPTRKKVPCRSWSSNVFQGAEWKSSVKIAALIWKIYRMFIVSTLFCLQITYVTNLYCSYLLLPGFPSSMSSRSQPSCSDPTVLENVPPFFQYLDEILLLIFHCKPQGSLERSQGANVESAIPDSCGKICFILIFWVKKKNDRMMLLLWHKISKLVAARSVRGSGDHKSHAARRAVSTWIGDRLANNYL